MRLAYVDTSSMLAVAFGEPEGKAVARRMGEFDRLVSSNLLEAEFRAALVRENVEGSGDPLLAWLTWIHPGRQLTPEYQRVLACGYVRGADLWHLACALFLRERLDSLAFVTLDARQLEVAKQLGMETEDGGDG